MSAQEDHDPTSGQPTQAQDDADPGQAPPRKAAAKAPDPAAADAPSARTERSPLDEGTAAARRADDDDGGGEDGARRSRRQRPRDDAGRYVRSSRPYRGLDLSLHDFRAELSAIADDVGYLLRNESVVNPELKAQLEQRFDRLRGTVSLMADDAREAGERLRHDVQDRVEQRIRASRGAVQERPITSVAMAAIVGLSVGLLLSRRR